MAGSCVPVDFNPQGPRGPRRHPPGSPDHGGDFNPQGPRGPRRGEDTLRWMRWSISIHKALAGLDSKTIQQSLHIPLTFYALCPPPSLFQPPPSIHPAYFHGFSSVFQVRISRTFHVSLAFAPGLMGFRLTEITLYLYTT